MVWFWQEFDPQIQVIRSFIIQATFAMSHTSSPKRKHEDGNVEDHEGDMMVDIDDVHLQSLQASGTLTEKLSSRKNISEIKCIIYDKFTKSKIYNKHRLEVDS